MKNLNISTIALAVGLAFSVGAMAEGISMEEQYESSEKSLKAEYRAAKVRCHSLSENADTICVAEAKSKKDIAMIELEDNYKSSVKSQYDARIAKSDAIYIASEKCEALNGTSKGICGSETKISSNQ